MSTDIHGKILSIGDKVHIVGKGKTVYYIIELGENIAGVNVIKNSKDCYGVLLEKIVKFKNQ